MTNDTFDGAVMPFIMVAVLFLDALEVLLSLPTKGVMIDPRTELLTKTNKELRSMLSGVKRVSKLNKKQMVDLLLTT
tara:strand:- start:2008 stop:2238 length:231 start_codon:yes stop_codon:yes gene_type:complete